MKRTDLAAPTVIDPAAFKFVAGVYFGSNPSEDFDEILGEWMNEKDIDGKAGWYAKRSAVLEAHPMLNPESNFIRKGTCDHCGARFDWGSVYQHTSGGHIVVGNTCADKTLEMSSRHDLDVSRMKAKIAAERKRTRMHEAAHTQARTEGFEYLYATKHTDRLLGDLSAKGLQYGGLSPRQVELVKKIHDGTPREFEVKRAERVAARAAEDAAAEPVPVTDARMQLEGVVLSFKDSEGPFGPVTKMLVKTTAGFKLYGTRPSGLDLKVGDRVAFAAKIERSRNDEKFGFYSRPTKARKVEVTPAPAPMSDDEVNALVSAKESADAAAMFEGVSA